MKLRRNRIAAAVDTVQIRRKFYKEFATSAQGRGSWWIRVEQFDTGEGLRLIVDDEDTGDLYKVPVAVNGDEVEFGEPKLVSVEYPEKAAAARAALAAGMAVSARDRGEQVVVFASRADSSPEEETTQEGVTMDEETRKSLAATLDLPEDASAEQIQEQIAANKAAADAAPTDDSQTERAGQQGAPGAQADDFGTTGPSPEKGPAGGAPTATGPRTIPPGEEGEFVQIPKEEWERVKAGALLAEGTHASTRDARINAVLDEYQMKGTFAPSARDGWKSDLERDFDGTKALLATMPENRIPMEARGSVGSTDGEGTSVGNGDGLGLPPGWFPEVYDDKGNVRVRGFGNVTLAREG